MKRVLCALIFCLVCVLAVDVNAQTWPSRPFKLIVPTGPGAATDVMARMLADGVSRKLDQPMVVENMPGASGIHQYLWPGDQSDLIQATALRSNQRFHGCRNGLQSRTADDIGEC